MLQYICSLTKPNVIEKYAVPIQNNQYKPAFQQRRKYVWCIFIWLHVANRRINHSFMSFPKYRSGFVQTCTHCRQDVEFRECCNWKYRQKLTNLAILNVQKFEQFSLYTEFVNGETILGGISTNQENTVITEIQHVLDLHDIQKL